MFDLALAQLPKSARDGEILARSESAGASHDLAEACRETQIQFSFGYPLTEPVRQALQALEESSWEPAIGQDGQQRDGAWVTELTDQINLADWPEGTRLICRCERPHPGAQLSFTDLDGHRFQRFITIRPTRTSLRSKRPTDRARRSRTGGPGPARSCARSGASKRSPRTVDRGR